jgi:Ala-tRNA(Pro) deacylase
VDAFCTTRWIAFSQASSPRFFICYLVTNSFNQEDEMAINKLKDYLNYNGVKYVTVSHSKAYTAQEVAASIHIRGKKIAKTVIVKIDGQFAMVVLPASYRVDFEKLKETVGAEEVKLASETDFIDNFPECEVGAIPPFGNLYGMKVYVAASIVEDEDFLFNAGSHTELMKLPFKTYEDLVQPQVVRMSFKCN